MGKSAPDPTDPKDTSAAATGTNVSTAIANNIMGNVNTYGPDGSTEFTQSGEYTWTDPFTNKTYTVPKFNQTTRLSESGQKIFDEQQDTKLNLSTLAKNQSGFLNEYMAEPFRYNPGEHENWALGLYDKLSSDRNAREMASTQSMLANSGIKLGSDAYDRAMESRMDSQQRARDQFLLDSFQTGFSTAQAQRNQPINEITALMSGSQVSQPQTPGFQFSRIPTTDNAGIIANYDNQRMAQWQAEQAMRGQMLGGLFSLGGAVLSDKRAKKDVKKIGQHKMRGDDGKGKTVGKYEYRYKGEPKSAPKRTGVMAQEVRRKKPSAVRETPMGLMAVDYARL